MLGGKPGGAKEATIFAIRAVTEVGKDKVEENVPKSNPK
jgi:hypothetical protein